MLKCSMHRKNGINNEANPLNNFLNHDKKYNFFKTIFKLFKMVFSASKLGFSAQISIVIIGGILPIITSLLWKKILEITANRFEIYNLNLICTFILFAIVGGVSVSFYYFSEIVDTFFRNKISLNFQNKIHEKSTKIPVAYYEVPQINDVINRAQDTFCYGPAVGIVLSVSYIISNLISLVSLLIVLWNFHYSLVAIFIPLSIPYLLRFYLNKINVEFDIRSSPKRREANVYCSYFTKYEYVKETMALDAGDFFMDKWLKVMKSIRQDKISLNIKAVSINIIIGVLENVAYISSVFLCLKLISIKYINIGEFGAVVMLLGQIKSGVCNFMESIGEIHEMISSVEKGFEYLDLKEE